MVEIVASSDDRSLFGQIKQHCFWEWGEPASDDACVLHSDTNPAITGIEKVVSATGFKECIIATVGSLGDEYRLTRSIQPEAVLDIGYKTFVLSLGNINGA